MAPLYVRSNGRGAVPRAAASRPPAGALPFGLPRPEIGCVQRPPGISLCMIVKNEERFLEACLRSVVGHVDELCIVDTGSTDRTKAIAQSFGATLAERPWRDDFAWARNEALSLASKRWILVLDADEELDEASHGPLALLRDVPAGQDGLWVRCNNLSDDYKGTGVSTHALVRFFPNHERIRYRSPVHEFITIDGKATGVDAHASPLSITHHGYLSAIVKERNKTERNLALVKAATEHAPDDPFNWYNLGTTSMLNGDAASAIDAFERMRTIVGDVQRGFVPNALMQLADLYIEAGNFERAIELARECLRKSPNFANAHFGLGRALAKLKRYPEAREAFLAAIADAAHSARQFVVDDEVSAWKAQSEIGSSYGYEGNDMAALEWFERGLQNRPHVVPLRMNRGKALERLGRFSEAEAMYRGLADDEPGDAHSVDYINFLLRREEYTRVIETIERVHTLVTPRTAASLFVLAAKLTPHTGLGDSQTWLNRAFEAHPGAADVLEALETFFTSRGDTAALQRLQHDEFDAPLELPQDYARRASRHLQSGRLEEAERVALSGLAIAPRDAALQFNLAAVLVQTQRKDDALRALAVAGREGDIGLRAMFLRSIVLADLGRHQEAIAEIDMVIARAPAEIEARLARFRFADALGWDHEAEATLRPLLDDGNPKVAAEFATWLMRKGRFDDARRVADRALQSA